MQGNLDNSEHVRRQHVGLLSVAVHPPTGACVCIKGMCIMFKYDCGLNDDGKRYFDVRFSVYTSEAFGHHAIERCRLCAWRDVDNAIELYKWAVCDGRERWYGRQRVLFFE